MDIYDLEAAFGAVDVTTEAMRSAIAEWFAAYYDSQSTDGEDSSSRVAYTVVSKLLKTVFGEYTAQTEGVHTQKVLRAMEQVKEEALQLALVGGEVYLRPVFSGDGFYFGVVPRDRILIFSRDYRGMPTDVGSAARTVRGKHYYTLLERRSVDEKGYLTVKNALYKSSAPERLGVQVSLKSHSAYAQLSDCYTYAQPVGSVGLIRLRTPILNCVDGSDDGVSVYAAAMGLIHAIDSNEAQFSGEFQRGQSRIVVSRDMLTGDKKLESNLFVGLDEDPENVGIHIFSPQLRVEAYLARKQEYLRAVESVIGLKRGMLSDANEQQRTATEIASSAGDFNLTVISFQRMWEQALTDAAATCALLSRLYGRQAEEPTAISVDWGNGVLYDEDVQWAAYCQMVADGMLKPEIALGWRFGMPAQTPQQCDAIRKRFMPEEHHG